LFNFYRKLMKLGGSAPRQLAPLSFPPPYQRMVAINSDVEFTTWTTQIDLLRCFTERRLETSFSYWFFGHSDITWHLFHPDMTLTEDGSAALPLLHEGVFDTVHSFTGVRNGPGYYLDRDMIHRGYKQLAGLGIVPRVYSNHGTEDDIQNIGGTWTGEPGMPWYMKGDLPGSRCYHLDLSLRHGIRFFWLDVDVIADVLTFAPADGPDTENLFVSQICRDGSPILRFRRTNANVRPDGEMLGAALDNVLQAEDGGYTIIYTHLGVKRDAEQRPLPGKISDLPQEVFDGLDRLAADQDAGRTLVTTTARLLTYSLMSTARPWVIKRRRRRIEVYFREKFVFSGVSFCFDWEDFAGFCLPVGPRDRVWLCLSSAWRTAEHWCLDGQNYAGLRWVARGVTIGG